MEESSGSGNRNSSGLLLTIAGGVRLFALFPIGGAFAAYLAADKNPLPIPRAAVIGGGLAGAIALSQLAFTIRATDAPPLDAAVTASFLTLFGQLDPQMYEFDNAIERIFSGLVSYLAVRVGFPYPEPYEPAHLVAFTELHGWVESYNHNPATIYFDLWMSSGYYGPLVAVVIGAIISMVDGFVRSSRLLYIFLLPAAVAFQYSIVRGAVYNAGSTISAVVPFSVCNGGACGNIFGAFFPEKVGRPYKGGVNPDAFSRAAKSYGSVAFAFVFVASLERAQHGPPRRHVPQHGAAHLGEERTKTACYQDLQALERSQIRGEAGT